MGKSSPISLFNPFALGTFVIACIAWIIAFAGCIACTQSLSYFPKFSWWGLVYQLFLLITVAIFYVTNTFHFYRLFLTSGISIAFIYNSNSTNNLIYVAESSSNAASAGFVILCMTNLLWLFYFGSEPSSPIVSYIDSFGSGANVMVASKSGSKSQKQPPLPQNQYYYKDESLSFNGSQINLRSNDGTDSHNPFETQEYASQLKGLENFSTSNSSPTNNRVSTKLASSTSTAGGLQTNLRNSRAFMNKEYDSDYPILVNGIYDYVASPDDINELSFKKGEIFRVKDTNGNWWQGKNSKGEIGMCPSNYLEVMN